MKLSKRAIIVITSGVLLIGGVAACKHKMHSASPEERGEWMVEKVSKELELNDNQQLRHEFFLNESDEQAILVVAASSPKTLEQARYRLQIEELR